MLKKEKGFTLIELVLVIAILGILAVAALPTFIDVTADAATAARDGMVGSVRSGIMLFRADLIAAGQAAAWPGSLGNEADSANCTAAPCFETVIQGGIIDSRWTRTAVAGQYQFSSSGVTTTYTYDGAGGFASP